MDMFGIPMMKVRMIRVYVVVSQNIDIMKSICTSLSLSLSRYGIISEITVLCKEDYKFFLDNNHCDLCIVDIQLFNEVTNAYPFLYCSPITFKDKIVFLFLLVLFVGWRRGQQDFSQIERYYPGVCENDKAIQSSRPVGEVQQSVWSPTPLTIKETSLQKEGEERRKRQEERK